MIETGLELGVGLVMGVSLAGVLLSAISLILVLLFVVVSTPFYAADELLRNIPPGRYRANKNSPIWKEFVEVRKYYNIPD